MVSPTSAPHRPSTLARCVGPILLSVTGLAMLAWTWGTWPDAVIDFGRELYVPWQLAQGKVLYQDIAWFNGPLSPYFNALWFAVLGPGLLGLVVVNLVLLAALAGLLYRHLVTLSGRFAATCACLFFLAVFAFGQQLAVGNFNYVCPYSHEATHGMLLAVTALVALHSWRGNRRGAWVAVAGLALGLCFLTKPELFLAAVTSCGIAFVLPLRDGRGRGRWTLGLLLASALIPIVVAFAALSLAMPPAEALRGVLGGWPAVLGGKLANLAWYRAGLGFDQPAERVVEAARWVGGALAVFFPAAALAFLGRGRTGLARGLTVIVFLAVGSLLWSAGHEADWLAAGRPLPLFALVAGVAWSVALIRRERADERAGGALAFSVFALVLLLKIILNARVSHYGFVLAMPATLLTVVALTGWIPEHLGRRGAAQGVFIAAALAAIVGVGMHYVDVHVGYLSWKKHTVGAGVDRFEAGPRGIYMRQVLRLLEMETGPTGTAVVLPEGVMLNYLARRENPTPYVNFMPPELVLFGEGSILAALRATPPDVVVLIHRHTREYGFPFFGRDYGLALYGWVRQNYRTIRLFGEPPLQPDTTFGVELLVRSL